MVVLSNSLWNISNVKTQFLRFSWTPISLFTLVWPFLFIFTFSFHQFISLPLNFCTMYTAYNQYMSICNTQINAINYTLLSQQLNEQYKTKMYSTLRLSRHSNTRPSSRNIWSSLIGMTLSFQPLYSKQSGYPGRWIGSLWKSSIRITAQLHQCDRITLRPNRQKRLVSCIRDTF